MFKCDEIKISSQLALLGSKNQRISFFGFNFLLSFAAQRSHEMASQIMNHESGQDMETELVKDQLVSVPSIEMSHMII
jgi:hypothetical protein